MKTRVFATLGPASLRGDVLRALEDRVDGVQIELSQTSPEEVDAMITLVRRHARSVPICLRAHASRLPPPASAEPAPKVVDLAGAELEAIQVGLRRGVRRVALSSPRDAVDVHRLRAILPDDALVLSVIDSASAWQHRLEVMDASDAVVINRGHLGAVTPTEYFPYRQKAFLRYAQRCGRAAYVANGPHQPMTSRPTTTVAQSNDIAHSLLDGARGFVLTAETATGPDPVGSVDALIRCVRAFEHQTMGWLLEEGSAGPELEPAHLAS